MKNINELILERKKTIITAEDKEKIEVIEELIQDETCFFKIDSSTAVGILDFLGVPRDEIMDYYYSLISFDTFQKIPKVRELNEELLENGENKL